MLSTGEEAFGDFDESAEDAVDAFLVDLAQMVRSLLQVEPRNRPTIDKVLATPGLVRHLT